MIDVSETNSNDAVIEINNKPLANTTAIKKYIDRINTAKKIKPLGLLLPVCGGIVLGILAGIPYAPSGYQVGTDWGQNHSKSLREFMQFLFPVVCVLINAVLSEAFFYDNAKEILLLCQTPDELKDLMPSKYPNHVKALAALALLSCATASTVPFVGLSIETKSPLWILIINIISNIIFNGKALSMAVQKDNLLCHKHLLEPLTILKKSITGSELEKEEYLDSIKYKFILHDLYQDIFKNISDALSSNANYNNAIATFKHTSKKRGMAYNISEGISGSVLSGLSLITLMGYLAGTFLLFNTLFGNEALSLLGTIISNLCTLYLILNATYTMGTQFVNTGVEIYEKGGLRSYLDSLPDWFRANEKKQLAIFVVFSIMAMFSFPPSVDLINKNMPQIGWNSTIPAFGGITIAATGFFNGYGIPAFLKGLGQFFVLSKELWSNQEDQSLNPDTKCNDLHQKIKHAYIMEEVCGQLSRIPEDKFLEFFLNYIQSQFPDEKDTIINQCSSGKLSSSAELNSFLYHQKFPVSYKNTASTSFFRTFQKNNGIEENLLETSKDTRPVQNFEI